MQSGLILLCLAYVLSQFFRAFLSVLSIPLGQDLGVTPQDLADASGYWFLTFALMQIPVGRALDRIGPRRTGGWLLLFGGGGGAALFALAQSPGQIEAAMVLIGIGCSPVLMASYYIFARQYPPARFATLAAVMLGVGSFGNLFAAWPTAVMAEAVGWRATLWGLAGISVLVGLGILSTVKDPPPADTGEGGSLLTILKIPAIWALLPLMFFSYAPSAAIRGVWIGPYLDNVFGLTLGQIGTASLIMGAAMILGTFTYGPLDRVLGTRKWVIFGGNLGALAALVALVLWPQAGIWQAVALMSLAGFFGASFPVLIAHGRAFFPAHLVGRGVTLLNLFGIGGVGVMNFVSGEAHALTPAAFTPAAPYATVFALMAATLAFGLIVYLLAPDRTD
ncbi:MAG: MFS transporter [Rhodobacteraceae bacterium]|nr:MFS transporter [Paracoccaceae bacterium]